MTPTFMGSEPDYIEDGPNAGIRTFVEEENQGLAFYRTLNKKQRSLATLSDAKTVNNSQLEAFHDNEDIPYSGIQASAINADQKALLLELIDEYVGRMREGHAAVKMDEVKSHLDDTWFSWIGGSGDQDVFYYRIHSPVIMIEFDHHRPALLRDRGEPKPGPVKWHVHTVVRTPNGNDYGKDLLKQHLEDHTH